jgi:hypothetical protein
VVVAALLTLRPQERGDAFALALPATLQHGAHSVLQRARGDDLVDAHSHRRVQTSRGTGRTPQRRFVSFVLVS